MLFTNAYALVVGIADYEHSNKLRTLQGHSGGVAGVTLGADERLAISASYGEPLKVGDVSASLPGLPCRSGYAGVATGEVVSTLPTSAPLLCCAMTPDGRTIVAGDEIEVVHFLE